MLERRLAELLPVSKAVVVASEARLAIDAALHDVLRDAGKDESREPRHGAYPDRDARHRTCVELTHRQAMPRGASETNLTP
ncbi:hypothetical protein GCM10007067_15150 [Lysobacter bugurensis]|uniref:Uncharacterized protein n=1 Tax=Cognatilysobacter bugurensis TaxID=543356 RepID=A0A918W7V5_9GAMM|nr:hypothetical protein GCM10007067_15150 [Lysobacter bugurensis]